MTANPLRRGLWLRIASPVEEGENALVNSAGGTKPTCTVVEEALRVDWAITLSVYSGQN